MIKIAITGGIGCGKSAVTEYLQRKAYLVIDADKMAREMTCAGGAAIPYIIENFGPDFIDAEGNMDRAKMRDLVFNQPDAKRLLEAGTTVKVLEEINEIIEQEENKGTKLMFFDIPLLFENKQESLYDQVWVVTARIELRRERIKRRDGLDDNIIDLIIGSQAEEDYKISMADVVINNSGSFEELYALIDQEISKL